MRTARIVAQVASLAMVAAFVFPALPAAAVVDTTAPVVTGLAPATTYKNMATTFTANFSDPGTGVASCTLYINGISQRVGIMTRVGVTSGTASQSYTYTGSASSFTAQVSCTDMAASPNTGYSSPATTVTVFVDNSQPVVSNVQPSTATAGVLTTITATYEESGAGINYCRISINSVEQAGNMGISGSTASISYQFSSAGTYTVGVNCYDKATNSGSSSRSVVVSAAGGGATATMGTLTPTTATAGSATTFSTTITDTSVKWTVCSLHVGGSNVATLTRSGSTVSGSYTFPSAGTFSTFARCQRNDDPPEAVDTLAINVVVSAAGGGATASMGTLTPTTATAGASTAFATTINDSSFKYDTCSFGVGGTIVATFTRSGSNVTGNYTFASPGTYNQVYVSCLRSDSPTQYVITPFITVTVSAASGGADTVAPTIASLNPTTATDVLPVSMIADVSDNIAPESCTLTVGGVLQGAMTMSVSALGPTIRQASRIHLFSTIGSNIVEVRCLDAAGNVGSLTRTVTVSAAGTPPPPPAPTSTDTDSDGLLNTEEATLGTSASNRDTDGDQLSDYEEVRVYHSDPLRRDTDGDGYNDGEEVRNGYSPTGPGTLSGTTPNTGTLIKMPCPVGASVNHPCKAVYFYGRDGKRHPFPHEKTYFSWYPNFGSVQNVSEAAMSALPLGTNVTYRPGVRLVKFQTLNTVYAVTRAGALRALASESVAVAIYGTAWNRQVDDIGDAFFSNYTFGADITQANQYTPLAETAAVLSIDDNF